MIVPLPTNIIPYWLFPWNTNTWYGYTQFVAHKEILVIDAIRQMYPWKVFAFSLLRQGTWPLWNPYNFAGQPFLANFQTTIFYPLCWPFLFLPPIVSWSFYILIQPVILFLASWLFFRSVFRSRIPSLLSAIGITFTAFFSIHYFWGTSTHPLIWLPFSFWLTELVIKKQINYLRFSVLSAVVFTLIILGGYPQSAVFGLLLSGAYFLFRAGFRKIFWYVLPVILAVLLCAVQLLPTLELYRFSPREGKDNQKIITESFAQPKQLIMTFSPDFFGSPATNNYEGDRDYTGVNNYFGIALLPLALYALIRIKRDKSVVFWGVVAGFGLIMALPNSISYLPSQLKIPILGSGAPWYYLFFYQIGMISLAGFGLKELERQSRINKLFAAILILVGLVFGLLLLSSRNSPVAFNSTLKVAAVFTFFAFCYFIRPKFLGLSALIVTVLYGLYFTWRVMPFGELKYLYPYHPITNFLTHNASVDRFWGPSNALLPSNLGAYYRAQQLEGYDSLWPKRYGELAAAAETGKFPDSINRAEVKITDNDTPYRRRFLQLMGVKYYLDKSDNPQGDDGQNPLKFPFEKFTLAKQWGPVSVYEDKTAFPRAFLADSYILATGDQVLEKTYDLNVNLRNTVVLEKDPKIGKLASGSATIAEYQTNSVKIQTVSSGPSLLLLSDNYFPGWNVYVNGIKGEILRADYSLRATVVPAGSNEVSFVYEPQSFQTGKAVSLFGLIILCALLPLSFRKNIFRS